MIREDDDEYDIDVGDDDDDDDDNEEEAWAGSVHSAWWLTVSEDDDYDIDVCGEWHHVPFATLPGAVLQK